MRVFLRYILLILVICGTKLYAEVFDHNYSVWSMGNIYRIKNPDIASILGNPSNLFFIPVKIVIIWIAAVTLFIISLLFKKDMFHEKDSLFRGISIVTPVLFFCNILFFMEQRTGENFWP